MFNPIESAVKKTALFVFVSVVALILGLCGWIWNQSQKIDSLTAENQAQAQTIQNQEQVNLQLVANLEQERLAVEKQQLITANLKNKIEVAQSEIKQLLQKDACANIELPGSVVDSLKRLHKQNYSSN